MRFWIGVVDQVSNAVWADWMASSTSAAVQHGVSANTSPVEESVTGMYLPDVDSRHSLSMQNLSFFTSVTTCAISFLSSLCRGCLVRPDGV